MRRLHNLTILAAAASLMAMMGLAASSARAENNSKFQPAPRMAAPAPHTKAGLTELRSLVKKANQSLDGCG